MKTLAIIVAILPAQIALADTLILKDGKKLEWSALVDKGDVLEVELKIGTKVTVKKDEIERVVFTKPPDVLTGASLAWDRKQKLQVADVLPKIDVSEALYGTARKAGGGVVIVASPSLHTLLPCGFTPPAEYDLSLTVGRKGPVGTFVVGVVVDGKQTTIHLDAYKNSVSGIMSYNGEDVRDSSLAYRGAVFGEQPIVITCQIRATGFVVRVGEIAITSIAAENFPSIKLNRYLVIPDRSTLFIGALGGEFTVSKMAVTFKR
jgi:hypothetical protein